ncbi:MAG TPA: hypothetical protein VG797_00125 [Phycisphaerales bacterium]|nr:hypothetical protein [Phycisphaerales bacterium]
MFISDLLNSGSLPVLETAAQFAGRRQTLLAHNIANLSTPNFQPADVSVKDFQASLAEAVDRRRKQGGDGAPLDLKPTREIEMKAGGGLALTPRTGTGNVLFHDRNTRDLERLMQDLAENTAAFRVATDLFKSRLELINQAIRER